MTKLSSYLMLLVLISCNYQSPKTTKKDTKIISDLRSCYQYVGNKDIIVLMLVSKSDSVSGTLSYSLYEKDNSMGTIHGQINGDLLIADYTYQSEGIVSVRQVAFKKSGTSFIEGYGEVRDENNRTVFKNADSLDFNRSVILGKVLCK